MDDRFRMNVPKFWSFAAQKARSTRRPQDVLVDAPICEATHEYIVSLQTIIDEQDLAISQLLQKQESATRTRP